MGKQVVLHPFLFAAYPVLFLFSHNIDELLLRDMLWPLGSTLIVAVAGWIGLKPLVSDPARRGLVLSTVFLFFFSYGHVYNLVEELRVFGLEVGRHRYLIPLWILFPFAGVYLALRTREQNIATQPLNILAVALVLYSVVNIGRATIDRTRIDLPGATLSLEDASTPGPDMVSEARDIYYIILDRYGSAQTLADHYQYDNSPFLDYLVSSGFFVAEKSYANYPKTLQSLASSLNATYLNEIAAIQGHDSHDMTPLFEMLQDHAVGRFLKSRGYRYLHFGSWWPGTTKNRFADANMSGSAPSQILMVLYETTLMFPLTSGLGVFSEHIVPRRAHHARVLDKLSQLTNVPEVDGPVFTFVHLLVPHDPYVFDRSGEFVSAAEARRRGRAENFLGQLEFINRKLQELVESLLAQYETKPIIILQGDEGPFPERYVREGSRWWASSTRAELAEKCGILSAYYLPDGGSDLLYEGITPVNTFRVVLNFYFGTKLPMLADRSYAISSDEEVYSFYDITDSLRFLASD